MRDEHRGERPASRFLASVDGCHSVETRSRCITKKRRSSSRIETQTVTHCAIESQSNSTFKTIQSSPRRQGKRNRRKSESADGLRKWVYAKRDCSGFKDKVVIVSYNVLGVENVTKHPDLYFNIPPKYLGWDHRKELIRKEIKNYHPGILCFQEVDRFNDLEDALQRDGFKGVYQARTGDAPDGCAIFWNNERFTLLHEEHMEFQSFGLRNNVAQFCVLQMSSNQLISDMKSKSKAARSSRSMVVGNIHVLFNPNRGDIKLGQIRLFLERAHKLAEEWGRIPVVLAGDLNSVPQSAVYQFMSSAELDLSRHDRKRISGQMDIPLKSSIFQSQQEGFPRWNGEELKLATGDEHVTCLLHYLKLCSAYPGVPGNLRARDSMGEPLATSCHSKFLGTVDYIWHTEELIPVRVLETLPVNVLRKMGGLPNKKWGSDHLALVCEFGFA